MGRLLRVGVVVATLAVGFAFQQAVIRNAPRHPVPRLETVPLTLGSWQGVSDTLSQDVIAALRPDAYLLRTYRPITDGPPALPIVAYVAYYAHPTLNERIHSPAACLPSGGWVPVEAGQQQIVIPGALPRHLTANRYLVQLGGTREMVLYWFQGRGRTVASEVHATLFLAYDTLRGRGSDEALVRISAPVQGTPRDALGEELRFIQRFYPQLIRILTAG
jgi:EpsI family protein